MITFLSAGAGIVVINFVSGFLKNYILPRVSGAWMHVIVFVVSLVVSAGYMWYSFDPTTGLDFLGWVKLGGEMYAGAVAFYEAVLKRV